VYPRVLRHRLPPLEGHDELFAILLKLHLQLPAVSAPALKQRRLDHEAALRAIAHPDRRRVLQLAAARELSSGDIAAAIGWSRPAASQHLRVLRDAVLVDVRVRGNQRLYHAHLQNINRLRAFLDSFWGERLSAVAAGRDPGAYPDADPVERKRILDQGTTP